MIVVDSSAIIDLLQERDTFAARKLREIEDSDTPFAVPAVACQEILQGARGESDWEALVARLATQHIVSPADPWAAHVGAARIHFDCRRKGLTVRSAADCLIAQLVLSHDAVLLHNDRDFEQIAKVRPLRTFSAA